MSITQALRQAIEAWLAEKNKRSLNMLVRFSKVSYSTISRIMQGETDKPSAETAIKLAAAVMTKAELKDFTQEFYPKLAEPSANVSFHSGEDMREYLEDKKYIPLILLASHSEGTNENEVRNYFGNDMSLRFVELINSGHLVRVKGGNWRLEKDVGSINLETARECLAVTAAICPSLHDKVPRASLAHAGWESVNFVTALAVYHAAVDFSRTATKLTADKNNRGDILILFGSLFNVLKGVEVFGRSQNA